MPIIGCVIVFFMVNKSKIEFKWKLLITLTSMVFILTMLEIGEYLFDVLWDLKTQGVYVRDIAGLEKYKLILGKNDDTMMDLILGTLSSLIFVLGKTGIHHYKKYHKKVFRKRK